MHTKQCVAEEKLQILNIKRQITMPHINIFMNIQWLIATISCAMMIDDVSTISYKIAYQEDTFIAICLLNHQSTVQSGFSIENMKWNGKTILQTF